MDPVLAIESPIHSVYMTPNTPGSKIPSHGTSKYGEMYAIDFVVLDKSTLSRKPYKSSVMRYLLKGLPLTDFYGWGEKIHAPIDGEVVKVVNDVEERDPVNIFKDVSNTSKVTRGFIKKAINFKGITGNCVIIQYAEKGYCLLAHLKKGSIRVKEGQKIERNEILGELGHSGNSTMPHLHMQFMDSLDFEEAKGIPFLIKEYWSYQNGNWVKKINSVPKKGEIIKSE